MLPPRILGLLVILLAVQALCKPTKSAENKEYEEDPPLDDEDEDEEEEDDNSNTPKAPPQILSNPQSVRVFAGNTIVLPCQVVNSENYAIVWLKDNTYLYVESRPQVDDPKRIVRLSNNSLVIYNATVKDSSNNYKCSIQRQPDTIDVIHRVLVDPVDEHRAKIIRVIPNKRIKVKEGDNVKFGCEMDTDTPVEIKWFNKNAKVNNGGQYDPNVILDNNYIVIKNVNKSHSGLYQCLAEDGSKNPAMEAINVDVLYRPEIEVKQSIIHSGINVESEMTCIVSANPTAIIKWFKDGKELIHKKGSISLHHGAMKNNTLKIKHVLKITHTSIEDFGEYKCTAENILGNETKYITLTGVPSQAKISSGDMTNDDKKIILKWHLESFSPISDYKLQYRRKGDENWNVVHPEVKDGKENHFIVEHSIEELQPGSYEAILSAKNKFGWSVPSELHTFTGDYASEMARKDKDSAAIQIQSSRTLLALILVVLSCAFTSL